jgi:hypothetical protein
VFWTLTGATAVVVDELHVSFTVPESEAMILTLDIAPGELAWP